MKIAALFLWMIAPLGFWGAVTYWGTPHVVWSYTFHSSGNGYGAAAKRHYISCTYIGWTGKHVTSAQQGRCLWIRLFKPEENQ